MKKNFLRISLESVCVVFVVLLALCRCFKFVNSTTLCIGIVMLLCCGLIKGKINHVYLDWFILASVFLTIIHKYIAYPWGACGFYLLACLSYFVFRNEQSIKDALVIISIFSIVNLFANIINITSPDLYYRIINFILTENAVKNEEFYYRTYGYMSGLSDHFSRNAYYCVAGGCVFAACAFARIKKKILCFGIFVIELATIMIIGKRGHFVFFIAAVLITCALISPNLPRRIMSFIVIAILLLVILGLLIEIVPSTILVLNRFTGQNTFGDISSGRFYLWKRAWSMIKEKPLIGWGYGYFSSTYKTGDGISYAGVHNDYLQWMCEFGIIGFICNMVIAIGFYVLSISELGKIIGEGDSDEITKIIIIWSVLFQSFVILYSLTGLPHFDYEINVIYYISLSVPIVLLDNPVCINTIRHRYIKWRKL